MAVRSLFETPLSEWDYASVAAFLEARVPENETIEYKANFAEHLSETLVSMPNGGASTPSTSSTSSADSFGRRTGSIRR